MKQKLLILLLLLGVCIGLENDSSDFYSAVTSEQIGLYSLLAVGLLALYLIPAYYLTKTYGPKQSRKTLALSLIFGSCLIGCMAAYGNSIFSEFWALILSKKTHASWEAALTAPFIEETLKALASFSLIYLLKPKSILQVLFIGAFVGLGFQVSEDISYITNTALEGKDPIIQQALIRISGAFASHWTYTAILTSNLYLFKKQKKLADLALGLSPVLLHFLWDSPLTDIQTTPPLVSPILTCLTLYLFYLSYQKAVDPNN
ncbi:PrsW family intramembrane metalloprotease [Streptococcus loxodontisalivarius]|uniref:RsiW-degrading membrane proteinase PrsW (M82 family) n=1 Tax=Streptococcus loxodontisalivarius TaxID=1349415 RepID=A0ABS2PSP1_9STRE|nr:PrsW family glutamic-type intramembrane protease [Streptococcus loxodontisalivarius]MBM7642570.1 RsiW-degrading membrane proteinase PrsW (M82 family) [Streptococcus loxodontisalivarius]